MANLNAIVFMVLLACVVTLSSCLPIDPVVDVKESTVFNGGRYVGVNVPIFFNMQLDTRPNKEGFKLSQSVLSGLVTTQMDLRRSAPNAKLQGPVKVTFGGITVFDNKAVAPQP